MQVTVVGAGPVGLFSGMVLARAGHEVTIVDRDPGPQSSEVWDRRGVMQFQGPHFFRSIVRQSLLASLPEVWDGLIAAGGIPAVMEGMPSMLTGLHCRRSTFERVLRDAAGREPRVRLVTGQVGDVIAERGVVTGAMVDGHLLETDCLVVAAGRAGKIADKQREPAVGGPCGFAYVSRMYRARPGVEFPSSGTPLGSGYDGYVAIVFLQDARTISTLIVRPTSNEVLGNLRHNEIFDRVAPHVPRFAEWVDPARFEPLTDVLPGANLTNNYRGQGARDGGELPAGLYFVGDAVCTTNPMAGRGVSLGFSQARKLTRLIAEHSDPIDARREFDAWCTTNIRPWYEDHVYWDQTLLRRYAGQGLDLDARIPSDVIAAAGAVDPSMMPTIGPFMAMLAPPASLDPLQEKVRGLLRNGWRPTFEEGPSADELTSLTALVA